MNRFENIMYHVAGLGALGLTGLLLTLAYYAPKGEAFLFTFFAVLPGFPAWGYLNKNLGGK
jgi:hypothetical protein